MHTTMHCVCRAGFWGCGVLLGYLLCFHASLGLRGLWIGIRFVPRAEAAGIHKGRHVQRWHLSVQPSS